MTELQARYTGRSPITYFYQVSERPLFTLNGAHLVSQGLAICGECGSEEQQAEEREGTDGDPHRSTPTPV